MDRFSILDLLLFPKGLYQRITDKKLTLYLGILFVGFIDMIFPIINRYSNLFEGKPQNIITYNIVLACIFAVVIGFVDVLFFAFPVFDFMKLIRKVPAATNNGSLLTKVMKIYITVHFLIIPFNVLLFYIFRNVNISTASQELIYFILLIDILLMPVWFSSALVRGVNSIFRLDPIFKRLVFVGVLSWNYLLGYALDYVRVNWILVLFR